MSSAVHTLLGKPKQEEVDLSQRLNCEKDEGAFTFSKTEVIYPPQAKKDNVILLNGGTVLKAEMSEDYNSSLGEDSSIVYSEINNYQKNIFLSALSEFTNEENSYADFLLNYKVKINDALTNQIEIRNPPKMPRFSVGFTTFNFDELATKETTVKASSFKDFTDLVKGNPNKRFSGTFSKFVFKFISPEAILIALEKVKDKVTLGKILGDSGLFSLRNQDGSKVEDYYDQFEAILRKEKIEEPDEIIISRCISYIFPIHSIDSDILKSDSSNLQAAAYYTIIGKNVFLRFPDMSGNTIEKNENIYGLGICSGDIVNPDKSIKRKKSVYISLETTFSFLSYTKYPLKYMPPPVPVLRDYNLDLEADGGKSYMMTFEYEGLIGGNDSVYGVSQSGAKDYKIVMSLLSSKKTPGSLKGNLKNIENLMEFSHFPASSSFQDIPKTFNLAAQEEKIRRNYYKILKENNVIDEFENEKDFLSEFSLPPDGPKELIKRYGFIPQAFPEKTFGDKGVISGQSRYDQYLDLSGETGFFEFISKKEESYKNNIKTFKDLSSVTQDEVLASYESKIVDTENIKSIMFYSETFKDLKIDDTENQTEDEDNFLFYLKLKEEELKKQFIINSGEEVKFNVFVVDKYGQFTKVFEERSGHVSFRSERPSLKSISSSGKSLESLLISDNLNILLNVDGAAGVSNARLTLERIGFGIDSIPVENSFRDYNNTTRGGLFNALELKGKNKLVLRSVAANGLDTTLANAFGLTDRGRFKLELFNSEGTLLERKPFFVKVNQDDPSQVLESESFFEPDDISPRGCSDKKFLYDIPIIKEFTFLPADIRLKSRKRLFGRQPKFNGYLYIPIDFGTQSEAEVLDIVSDFCFLEKVIKINFDDSRSEKKAKYINAKSAFIVPNIEFNVVNGNFKIINEKKASLQFPGDLYKSYNIDRLSELSHAGFIFFNEEIDNISLNRDTINVQADVVDKGISYSLLPIGDTDSSNSRKSIRPFILPPRVKHIGYIRDQNAGGLVPSLRTNTFLNNFLQSFYQKIESDTPIELSDLKEFLPIFNGIGSTVYLSKKTKYLVVIFEACSFEKDLGSYDIYVGDEKATGFQFGPITMGKGRVVYKKLIFDNKSNKGVIVLRDINLSEFGPKDIKILRKDKRYKAQYTSKLIKSYTIEADVKNITLQDNSDLLVSKALYYQKGGKVSLIDDNFPLREEISDDKIALFSTKVKIIPDISTEYMLYPLISSDENNSKDINSRNVLSSFGNDAVNLIIKSDQSVILNDNFVSDLNENLDEIIKELGSENVPEELKEHAASDDAIIDEIAANAKALESSLDGATEGAGAMASKFLKFLTDTEQKISGFDSLSSISELLQTGIARSKMLLSRVDFDNTCVAIKDGIGLPNGAIITRRNYDIFTLGNSSKFKIFVNIEFDGVSNAKFKVPHLLGVIDKDKKLIPKENLSGLVLKPDTKYNFLFNDLESSDPKIELNGVRLNSVKNGVLELKPTQAGLVLKSQLNGVGSIGSNCDELKLTTDNSDYMNASKNISDLFAKTQADTDEDIFEEFFIRGKNKVTELRKNGFEEFCEKNQLKFIQEQICGGGYNESIRSFCDFSLQASVELNVHLKSFKQVLTVIKVIFCIIDVLCALTNPFKLPFALIRLFQCLYDLLLLLPQIAVPVMFLKLALHLIELLTCIVDKILSVASGINEIYASGKVAFEKRNVSALKNLQITLEKYILQLDTDLAVLDPIVETLSIFIELLSILFRFPCNVSEGDDLGVLCLEASNLAGLIGSKVAPNGQIEHENLIPVCQTYTTLNESDADACGNTPSDSQDDSDANADIFGFAGCGFGSGIVKSVKENYGAVIAQKSSSEKFSDVIDVTSDEEGLMRISNGSGDFHATYAVSYTQTVKNKLFDPSALITSNPRKVVFEFGNKAESFGLGNWIIFKKIMKQYQTFDSPIKLLKKDNENRLILSAEDEKGSFVSMDDSFTDFSQEGSGDKKHSAKSLRLEFETLDGDKLSLTYDTVPSIAIMDDDFNIYFIEENGIEFNDKGEIKSISALLVNSNSAKLNKFSETESQVPKAGEPGIHYKMHSNYLYLDGLGKWDAAFANSEKSLSDFSLSTQEIADAPYPQPNQQTTRFAKNYATGNEDDANDLASSTEAIKTLEFPTLYFVDIRQFVDEIVEACQVNGIGDLFGTMELDDNSSDDISDIINNQIDCIKEFVECINNKKVELEDGFNALNFDLEPFSNETIIDCYKKLLECTDGSVSDICKYVVNPMNTGFKLISDTDQTPREDALDPSDIDPEILAEISGGLENFDSSNITGAEEYASGIGDSVEALSRTDVVFEITPRDSYDDPVAGDLSEKILISIISDETGGAKIKSFGSNFVEKDGNSYYGSITTSGVGKVKIIATICAKTVKAFSYKGLVLEETQDEFGVVTCVEVNPTEDSDLTPVGSVIRIDRVLTINFLENKTTVLLNAEDDLNLRTRDSQNLGTKLEN